MDVSSWLSVVALVLVIPLGVITNLLTPRVIAYLEKRKLLKSHRTKSQDIAAYKRIESFKDGTRDKYPFYILLATASVLSGIASATCIVLFALNIGTGVFIDLPNPILLVALFFACLAVATMGGIYETARRIENFEQYQAEIRKKWGENAV